MRTLAVPCSSVSGVNAVLRIRARGPEPSGSFESSTSRASHPAQLPTRADHRFTRPSPRGPPRESFPIPAPRDYGRSMPELPDITVYIEKIEEKIGGSVLEK